MECPLIDNLDLSCRESIKEVIDKLKEKLKKTTPELREVDGCRSCKYVCGKVCIYCTKNDRGVGNLNTCDDWERA